MVFLLKQMGRDITSFYFKKSWSIMVDFLYPTRYTLMRDRKIKKLEIYATNSGKKPFIDWIESLKDKTVRYRLKERLDRVSLGNMGDYKYLECGVSEFRFDFGSGYRIYFAEEGKTIILLLSGGDKSTQKKDIKKAIAYWKDYQAR